MIKPTIGRKVWFHPNGATAAGSAKPLAVLDPAQALDATVVFVHDDRMVNLLVVDHRGDTHAVQSCTMRQEGDAPSPGMYCEWMPFQNCKPLL